MTVALGCGSDWSNNWGNYPESANFGAVIPSTVNTRNILPRQIQVRFKFFW